MRRIDGNASTLSSSLRIEVNLTADSFERAKTGFVFDDLRVRKGEARLLID